MGKVQVVPKRILNQRDTNNKLIFCVNKVMGVLPSDQPWMQDAPVATCQIVQQVASEAKQITSSVNKV